MGKYAYTEGPLEKRRAVLEARWEDDHPDPAEWQRICDEVATAAFEREALPVGTRLVRKAA